MNNITGNSSVNFYKKFKVFHNFHQILMASHLQMFVLVQVTMNAPLVQASLARITRKRYSCQCECTAAFLTVNL